MNTPLYGVEPGAPASLVPMPGLGRELSRWLVGVFAIAVLSASTAAGVLLWWWTSGDGLTGKDLSTAQLDVVRIAASIAVGGGGLFAFYLAVRRQRATEQDLRLRVRTQEHNEAVADANRRHQEAVAAATERDTVRRAITEHYTRAIDQLGSDKAPVRLGALYALERLAQEHPELRQTVVNVLGAYLRMPWTPPPTAGTPLRHPHAVAWDGPAPIPRRQPRPAPRRAQAGHDHEASLEREVRATAQRLLRDHLRDGPAYWGSLDVDMSGAALVDLDFTRIHANTVTFAGARFLGHADFEAMVVETNADFRCATFTEEVSFRAILAASITFDRAHFGSVNFGLATVTGWAVFSEATFAAPAVFNSARFAGITDFSRTTFDKAAYYSQTQFCNVSFNDATFGDTVAFGHAAVTGLAVFDRVDFVSAADFAHASFPSATAFTSATFHEGSQFDGTTFADGTRPA